MYKSVILPLAKQDIKEATVWYNERLPGLGKKFITHIRKTVHLICQNPKIYAVRYDTTRAAWLDTFPYLIHFTLDDNKKIVVIVAVLHTARNPDSKEKR